MLLTITTTHNPAGELGYLLHKNPARSQTFDLSFGQAHVFYPEAGDERCTAALLLDVDPVGMVRGGRRSKGGLPLEQYINDRPYAAGSFLSVAISRVYSSALRGVCKDRPELVDAVMPLRAKISVLPCRGGDEFLRKLFEPLGYKVSARRHELDSQFPEWDESVYYTVELAKDTTLSELLTHLYVLTPVLDNKKHYYVGREEMEKLLKKGEGWLAAHPEKESIARRYLKYRTSLAREAIARLSEDDPFDEIEDESEKRPSEADVEEQISLNRERLETVIASANSTGAGNVVDMGCGEGNLLRLLLKQKQFGKIIGLDVSIRALEIAARKLRLESLPDRQRRRIELIHGSLTYRDKRLDGYDLATVIEVIEHLDPARLAAFERVLFEFARPKTVILTTPNREYNVVWENLENGKLRHGDHRFEWTRSQFEQWATTVSEKYGYRVSFSPIGPQQENIGAPTQMGVFTL